MNITDFDNKYKNVSGDEYNARLELHNIMTTDPVKDTNGQIVEIRIVRVGEWFKLIRASKLKEMESVGFHS